MNCARVNPAITPIMDGMGKNRRPWVTGSLPEGDYREKLVDLFLEKFHDRRDSRGGAEEGEIPTGGEVDASRK